MGRDQCAGQDRSVHFYGTMDADAHVEILRQTLPPFLRNVYPDGHKFMQDNHPKHMLRKAITFFEDNSINWWKTSPESHDLNPIENLWHELKGYVRREVKPRTKEELIQGICQFWDTVTIEKCGRYIRHLHK